jgi:hypothetical protein
VYKETGKINTRLVTTRINKSITVTKLQPVQYAQTSTCSFQIRRCCDIAIQEVLSVVVGNFLPSCNTHSCVYVKFIHASQPVDPYCCLSTGKITVEDLPPSSAWVHSYRLQPSLALRWIQYQLNRLYLWAKLSSPFAYYSLLPVLLSLNPLSAIITFFPWMPEPKPYSLGSYDPQPQCFFRVKYSLHFLL